MAETAREDVRRGEGLAQKESPQPIPSGAAKQPFGEYGDGQLCRSARMFRHLFVTGGCSAVTVAGGMIGRVSEEATTIRVRRRWGIGQPVCALCAGPGSGSVSAHHLTHGVSVFLCSAHRSDAFQRRRGGRDFVDELAGMWSASGCLSPRQRRALAGHVTKIARANAPARLLPGSYSWPVLRAEAERRFASGEAPRTVIYELRTEHSGGDAIVPSVRTMRRWFCESRWLAGRGTSQPSTRQGQQQRRTLRPLELIDHILYLGEPFSFGFHRWPRGTPRGSPGR